MLSPRNHWSEVLADYRQRGEGCVLVTMLAVKGSAPREMGTKMVVGVDRIFGSIGGGHLEHKAIGKARELLLDSGDRQHLEHYPLGAKLGQCCGGHVTLLFESFNEPMPVIAVFGAGHVARALVPILAGLPVSVTWIDSRQSEFPGTVPEGVKVVLSDAPESEVGSLASNTYYVVMTHLHPLDYAIAEAALKRKDAAFIGVIGSTTKARRFQLRLAHRGFGPVAIESLTCPIGLETVPGKQPMEIAVAVAGQLIARYHDHAGAAPRLASSGVKLLQKLHLNEPQP